MLRAAERGPLRTVVAVLEEARKSLAHDVLASIDVDPVQLL
jgi:hypothetical protein